MKLNYESPIVEVTVFAEVVKLDESVVLPDDEFEW